MFPTVSRSPGAGFENENSEHHAHVKDAMCHKWGTCGNPGKRESSPLMEEAEEGLGTYCCVHI